jgi:hypothetical protein
VRARLIALLMAGAFVVAAEPGRPESGTDPRTRLPASPSAVVPVSQLVEQLPDGADLIDFYRTARTVADVETANGKVKGEVEIAQSVASELARLHAAKMTGCEDAEQSHLDATVTKAQALSATLARIDRELTKSLRTMRQRVMADRSTSTRAKDNVNRYLVAVHELGRLNLQTQELAKAIQGVARNIKTTAASCNPASIPPLFAEVTPPNKVAATNRPRLTRRRRPASAAANGWPRKRGQPSTVPELFLPSHVHRSPVAH